MVSIIIPHYNRSVLLRQTVNSVLTQTNSNWELIIVDDGSADNEYNSILTLTEKDSRITVRKRFSPMKGPSACRNEGVAASKGPYIIFLDSDDLLDEVCVEQRLSVMHKYPELDMGIFLMKEFSITKNDSSSIYNYPSTTDNRINCFLEGRNPWAVTCPIWKKDFFLKCRGFDESFFYMEDPELHIRALLEEGILYNTFYDYPADCYYRVNFHDVTKKDFYENSIKFRICFYKKMDELISARKEISYKYLNSFQKGVVDFFTNLLLSRVEQFPGLKQELMVWANGSHFISPLLNNKLKILAFIYSNDNYIFKTLRLKGFLSKLLLPNWKK